MAPKRKAKSATDSAVNKKAKPAKAPAKAPANKKDSNAKPEGDAGAAGLKLTVEHWCEPSLTWSDTFWQVGLTDWTAQLCSDTVRVCRWPNTGYARSELENLSPALVAVG